MISEKLFEDMKAAMKSGDKPRLAAIRMLMAELKNARIAAGHELDEVEEQKVASAYAKKRKETVETYREAGRSDLAEKEQFEYDLVMAYLPPRMGEEELRSLIVAAINETGAEGMKDFGRVMKSVMASVGSQADGSEVSAMVKKLMTGKE
ncbi:MAG: GatB/YqeY domain-containing protein [Candidatus Latescibacterota bacterium]|nr:MAG: GatB/YqeY domain-containing protein [Candidatus Latescibacterota bacterium]